MKLPDINLDDRSYDQLAVEARSLISKYYPPWTDYNPSDPGITLLELFCFLIEASIYQMNMIPDRSYENFARLLGVAKKGEESVQELLEEAALKLKQRDRLMTLEDYEAFTLDRYQDRVRRAKAAFKICGNERYIEVTVLPAQKDSTADAQEENPGHEALCAEIAQDLKSRSLIASKIKAVAAKPLEIYIVVKVSPDTDLYYDKQKMADEVSNAIKEYLTPSPGGTPDKTGWVMGRTLYRSELLSVINNVEGVDYVEELYMNEMPQDEEEKKKIESIFKNSSYEEIMRNIGRTVKAQIQLPQGCSYFEAHSIKCEVSDRY